MKRFLTLRERLAIRILGLATWALPDRHPSIAAIYKAAWDIEYHNEARAALRQKEGRHDGDPTRAALHGSQRPVARSRGLGALDSVQ